MLEMIIGLLELFLEKVSDRETMDELNKMSRDSNSWSQAHDLFQRIRVKNLEAIRNNNELLEAQYCFEEVCAEALYNLTRPEEPFDPDTPFWIIPNAFKLAHHISVDPMDVVGIIAA